MVVDEITQVLSFNQDNWLAPYIAKNTNLHQQAKNTFEKDFFKLMNNSVYGKTIENETELPSIHDFHSTLGGKITQANYKHVQKVWHEFDCKNLGEYHDLYLKTDVLLLADIWTKFRQTAMHHYGLDPSHYVSAPALSWDGMLKMTGIKIELFTDMTMHDFTEKAKRGGIAMAGHRFLKANNPKMDYVIHYQELQYYIKLGIVVDEITQVLSFDQDNWLAPYIAKNTNLRQQSKNSFEKDFFKLMNNSVYGKTMENVRKYQDVKLMKMINENDEKKFLKKICKPSFKYARQLGNTLVGAHMGKASVILNKPNIVSASVLEDIYKDMAKRPDLFDLNDTKTIGLFKDEIPGNVITESYHIRAKSYHYVLADKSTKFKHKGVSKKGMSDMAKDTYFPSLGRTLLDDTIEKDEIFDPMAQVYQDCLFENNVFYTKNVGMRTKNHVISLVESEKKALSQSIQNAGFVVKMEDDPIYDIHSEEYIDDLIHVTIQRGLFKDVEDAKKSIKALAKMVISSKTSIDAFMKCPVPNIPNAFYDLVEAFYYSIQRERQSLAHDI
ncbi:hypothetical protein RhiirC2_857984 [Rhizophagus irregularis]|uniref:DNA-directed DNA polymerase n=1 Tax=Rhizophagus irregularis TaxID=588596 RepID=A0A2N1M8M3_9GLOM|nr:hypothetical protein RhiirC2_857984 [Rhizophagus irregularis]